MAARACARSRSADRRDSSMAVAGPLSRTLVCQVVQLARRHLSTRSLGDDPRYVSPMVLRNTARNFASARSFVHHCAWSTQDLRVSGCLQQRERPVAERGAGMAADIAEQPEGFARLLEGEHARAIADVA